MVTRRGAFEVVGLVLFVGFLLPFVVFTVPQLAGASGSYVVLSSSMSPSIQAGDVVLVDDVSPSEIKTGDVITFEPPAGHAEGDAERVTHRVVEVIERDDGLYFRTQGDANEDPDQQLVPAENVVGRVAFTIPKIGYVIQFAASDLGILLFIVVPAVLLMVSEAWTLVAAARSDSSSDGTAGQGDAGDEPLNEQSIEEGD